MAFSDKWRLADAFTVDQAAALWCGLDPTSFDILRPVEKHPDAAAIKQLILGAQQADESELPAGSNDWAKWFVRRRLRDGQVTREWLIELAKSKGERPEFLFDTLLPGREADQKVATSAVSAPEPKNRGGRPPTYNWDACTMEIIRIADLDNLPNKQADLVSRLQDWFQEQFGACPAESEIKARVSKIYNGLGRGRKPKSD